MADDPPPLTTLLNRLRAGDSAAREAAIAAAMDRLERMARAMLREYPRLTALEETWDVLQSALARLVGAMRTAVPEDTRAFFGLAAEQIRRVLLDLTKYYSRLRRRLVAGQQLLPLARPGGDLDPTAPLDEPADLDRWTAFHTAVERLPDDLREVFVHSYYLDRPQQEIADLLNVHVKTIRQRYRNALLQLSRLVQQEGDLPE